MITFFTPEAAIHPVRILAAVNRLRCRLWRSSDCPQSVSHPQFDEPWRCVDVNHFWQDAVNRAGGKRNDSVEHYIPLMFSLKVMRNSKRKAVRTADGLSGMWHAELTAAGGSASSSRRQPRHQPLRRSRARDGCDCDCRGNKRQARARTRLAGTASPTTAG